MKKTVTTSVTTCTCDWCDNVASLEEAKTLGWKTLTVFERDIDDDDPADETGVVLHLCAVCAICRPRVSRP